MEVELLTLAVHFLPGMIGGFIRGLAGVSKNVLADKKAFKLKKLVFTLIAATIIGGVTSIIVGGDWRVSLLAGYAGSDILDALYKIKFLGGVKKF